MPYEHLAFHYDALMHSMDYNAYAGYLLSLAGSPNRVLDLACGTGRLAEALCERGCDVVAVDGSAEMLTVAQGRGCGALFIQQDMTELDLYGTVEAAFCTIDALNYLLDEKQFKQTLKRVRLFLEPGGAFIFDLLTPEAFARRDGMVFMSDAEGVYCAWRSSLEMPLCHQEVTLFTRQDSGLWRRSDETHTERAYELPFVEKALKEAGFSEVRQFDMPDNNPERKDDERVVFAAR